MLGPVALRNGAVGGEYLLTTSQGGSNFYIGNNEHANGMYAPLRFGRGDARFERDDAAAIAEQELKNHRQQMKHAEEIEHFCTATYGVTFPMFAKIEVNGESAHPLYRLLKGEKPGLLGTEAIKWNFTKFLVDAQGHVKKRYAPNDTPEQIGKDLEKLRQAGSMLDIRVVGLANIAEDVIYMVEGVIARHRPEEFQVKTEEKNK